MRSRTYIFLALGLAAVVAWAAIDYWADSERRGTDVDVSVEAAAARLDVDERSGAVGGPAGASNGAAPRDVAISVEDREIFRRTMERARAERWDTLAIGDIMDRLGRTFVGTTYVPGTLEIPGPEQLVVNLDELDCVTYVENMLAMSRVIRSGYADFDRYLAELERIRYRNGRMDGYVSRLHYFSEWLADNEALGLIEVKTRELGGVADRERIDFMTTHAESYRQLSDPGVVEAIRGIERRLSESPRYYIPQDRIAEIEDGIREGDIIAATSSLEGLDVAHTGIAIRVDGRVHLMHAPLVGKAVEISELPLAERIQGIGGQDGIMVARPL